MSRPPIEKWLLLRVALGTLARGADVGGAGLISLDAGPLSVDQETGEDQPEADDEGNEDGAKRHACNPPRQRTLRCRSSRKTLTASPRKATRNSGCAMKVNAPMGYGPYRAPHRSETSREQENPSGPRRGAVQESGEKNALVPTLTRRAEMLLGPFPQAKESSHVNSCRDSPFPDPASSRITQPAPPASPSATPGRRCLAAGADGRYPRRRPRPGTLPLRRSPTARPGAAGRRRRSADRSCRPEKKGLPSGPGHR